MACALKAAPAVSGFTAKVRASGELDGTCSISVGILDTARAAIPRHSAGLGTAHV